MKNKYWIIVLMLGLAGIFTVQSCSKDESPTPVIYKADVPANPNPAVDGVVPLVAAGTYTLAWEGTTGSVDLYIGTEDPPSTKVTVTGKSYIFNAEHGGEYFWYLETKDANGIVSTSPLWNFYINSPPSALTLTAPANAAVAVSVKAALTWTCEDAEHDDLTYDVYFGTSETPGPVATGLTTETYSPVMASSTKYYWKIVATDTHGASVSSDIYSFTTDVAKPDYSVFNGVSSEVSPSISATATTNVGVQRIGTSNTIALYLPLADAMVKAGWGTVYTGTHPIIITYDPVTYVVTGAKQLWLDSFVDPTEMGPMYLTVDSGTIDAFTKKITITWVVSGNAYWGTDYKMKPTTYTMK